MKTFFVRYRSGKEECIKATSMHSTSTAIMFRNGKGLNAVVPLSEIIRASDSKSVTEWDEKFEKDRVATAMALHRLMKTKTTKN